MRRNECTHRPKTLPEAWLRSVGRERLRHVRAVKEAARQAWDDVGRPEVAALYAEQLRAIDARLTQ